MKKTITSIILLFISLFFAICYTEIEGGDYWEINFNHWGALIFLMLGFVCLIALIIVLFSNRNLRQGIFDYISYVPVWAIALINVTVICFEIFPFFMGILLILDGYNTPDFGEKILGSLILTAVVVGFGFANWLVYNGTEKSRLEKAENSPRRKSKRIKIFIKKLFLIIFIMVGIPALYFMFMMYVS